MAEVPLEEGDAPNVRDLLLEHFRDPDLEVEGKLGHRSQSRFTAGVTAEQFAVVEAQLQTGAAFLDLIPGREPPDWEVTLDRFHAPAADAAAPRGRCRGRAGEVRASFPCDGSGRPWGEPLEVLRKVRLSDCHVAHKLGPARVSPPLCPVDLRVSFSREAAAPGWSSEGAPLVYERRKRRQTWDARFWSVMLTRVDAEGRELFEVEVELNMKAAQARLEAAAEPRGEALRVTRELVGALRGLAAAAAGVPKGKKRPRSEELRASEPALRAALEAPEVRDELRLLVGEGTTSLHKAKEYLCKVLRDQCAAVDEGVLYRLAGQQVSKTVRAVRCQRQSGEAPCHAQPALA